MDLTTAHFNTPTLLVVAGATSVGKTNFSIQLAQHYNTSILSSDSRQFYKEMRIGTAFPSPEELAAVPHFFVGNLSIQDYYNISNFETDALNLLTELFKKNNVVIMTGGSGLYIDAVCKGIDSMPDANLEIREYVNNLYLKEGIDILRTQLKLLDPEFYATNDLTNHKRMIRALEVCLQTGQPYTSFHSKSSKKRNFNIQKYCLTRPREELFERINNRTDKMIADGWVEEAKNLYPYKHLNALNTVGYKELFDYLDGLYSLPEAIEKIKTHTRRYAKRQLTWFKRDGEYTDISL